MKIRGSYAFVIFGSTFLFLASGVSGEQDYVQKPVPTKEIFSQGRTIYQKQCLVCHGASGAGDGEAAYLLYPKPRDFTRNEFRLVSTNDMQATDEDLFKTITRGMPGSAMPSWNHLSENERWALVYYVRYLTELNHFKQEVPWPTVQKMLTKEISSESLIKITPEPKVTEERLQLGRELFVKGCAACHGLQGKGDGQQMMSDSAGLPLKPRDITAGIFKGSSGSEDLYYRIAGGIPGSPMPGYQAAFTDEEIWNLIHYVQTLSTPEAEKRSHVQHLRITARKAAKISTDPLARQWSTVEPVFVALMPLWWRDARLEGLEVKTLHDGKKIAFHLSWKDVTRDDSAVAVQSFSDGVAMQFSESKDLPTFAMGGAESPVTIWNWKAAWQEEKFITGWGAGNSLSDPERKSAGETAAAAGIGSLTTQKKPDDRVNSKGVWKDGQWFVVFVRELKAIDRKDIGFSTGDSVSVAFAVWDGAKRDRNGQKMVSVWNEVTLVSSPNVFIGDQLDPRFRGDDIRRN